ncbi:RusA family crossover junction endodeoxyribonuclease [Clostridium taeniosporum]|uniref:RusA family crossover junction endodeoxyribonuclease n=1 Tax=Clostridium taeniosporum TaxID=394958 RepID=A0A1D7XGT0_9CLOT|nr:RusA family crossover junction endodeoxyribonuclease [Clostridium taeniosporum]AOR22563.1 RusA family crossover junction endodeoxyribonuclease [Clostridium taeniosporum]
MTTYAKIIVNGSPITKSNFKLHNINGRAILPSNSGKYHDRYALYEQEIALIARNQNPDIVLEESLIAILKVYYKSEKRHPDTINITKSIFDGIEKSGLIINDAQITRIIVEEYYDKQNPRFELELFGESEYEINYSINKKSIIDNPKLYFPIKKNILKRDSDKNIDKNINSNKNTVTNKNICAICNNEIKTKDYMTADGGKTLICKKCFNKLF